MGPCQAGSGPAHRHSPPPPPKKTGLDPTWEETFEFPVENEATTRCFVKFLMGAEGEEKQIGDECEPPRRLGVSGRGVSGGLAGRGSIAGIQQRRRRATGFVFRSRAPSL
jgi:hypothetical protein